MISSLRSVVAPPPKPSIGIGKAVLVQAIGEDHRGQHRKTGGDQSAFAEAEGDDQNRAAGEADEPADDREDARRAAEIRPRRRSRPQQARAGPWSGRRFPRRDRPPPH